MALNSPGVQVSVIDESFYTSAAAGTRPLIVVATAANKKNGSGTGIAQGTLAANAGKPYLITSQRNLADTFGDPVFRVDSNNNPIHAGEQNEYGLQAAYSYLGVSNSVFVVRANLDLNLLDPQSDAPGGAPADGTFWLDTDTTQFGVFQWNSEKATVAGGQSFTSKVPTVILDTSKFDSSGPLASVGAVGDYAIVPGNDPRTESETVDQATSHVLSLYYKSRFSAEGLESGAEWVKVGSPGWVAAWPTIQASKANPLRPGDSIIVSTNLLSNSVITISDSTTTSLQFVEDFNSKNIAGIAARLVDGLVQIYATNPSITFIAISNQGVGTILTQLGIASGLYYVPQLKISKHTEVPLFKTKDLPESVIGRPTGSVWIKTTEPNKGARWRLKIYNANTQLWESVEAPLYPTSQAALATIAPTSGGSDIPVNTSYVQYNFNELPESTTTLAEFRVLRRAKTGVNSIHTKTFVDGSVLPGTYQFYLGESVAGSDALEERAITVQIGLTSASAISSAIAKAINSPGLDETNTPQSPFSNLVASVNSNNQVVIKHALGGEIVFSDIGDSTAVVEHTLGLISENSNLVYAAPEEFGSPRYVASNWVPLTITPDTSSKTLQSYYISANAPETLPQDGTLWYNSIVDEVDILIHNGNTWVGYQNFNADYAATNPAGPIVSATQPTLQTDGTPLVDGDLWIDTSDLENYPLIKRYNYDFGRWDALDTSDQTTENGVLFADVRYGVSGGTTNTPPSGSIAELLKSNYLDFDAPDPALYPRGMLLWNLRRSGFNVKKFVKNYIDTTADNIRYKSTFNNQGLRPSSGDSQESYYPHRWVTESGNQTNGSGSFGRKAQRKVILQALQAVVNNNDALRDTEVRTFNLIACPGYPELIGELINLNYDRGLTAFVVGDTPARLKPDSTTINDWGNNVAGSLQDDDFGLVSFDEYSGVFYPWGFTSDNAGNDVAVPPSHMILRMIALSDQVSYPWFAPAGTRRGGITNATAVGYVTSEGEFESVALNEGQRSTLYNVKVNPITFFTGAGLVNFGQKTRARNDSSLDRINVARLVIFLREQLAKLAKPYIFEPNDKITRDEIKQQVESLLLELIGQRALYDFVVVCDESNNTPARIDRNELYVDIAIEPVKAVEFIYIPIRLKNTGEIAGLK